MQIVRCRRDDKARLNDLQGESPRIKRHQRWHHHLIQQVRNGFSPGDPPTAAEDNSVRECRDNASKKGNGACECRYCRGRLTSLAFPCISKTPRIAGPLTDRAHGPVLHEVASQTAPSLLPSQAGSPGFDLYLNSSKSEWSTRYHSA